MSAGINQLQKIALVLVVAAAVLPTSAFARGRGKNKLYGGRSGNSQAAYGAQPTGDPQANGMPAGGYGQSAPYGQAASYGPGAPSGGGGCGHGSAAPAAQPMPVAAAYPQPSSVSRPFQYTLPMTRPIQYTPPAAETAAEPAVAPAAPAKDEQARGPDLVLEEVKVFEDATNVAGPAYSVRFRNQGVEITGKFKVAILASTDGQLHADMPHVAMEVSPLYPGAMQELQLRLPKCEFKYLIVMVDATEVVPELDETNNTAILERDAITH